MLKNKLIDLFKRTHYLLALALTMNVPVSAQTLQAAKNNGYWMGYFGEVGLSPVWGIHTELQLRNQLLHDNIHSTLARIGVNYHLNPHTTFTVGYGYITQHPDSDVIIGSETRENRIWQQLLLKHSVERLKMDHRYRLEQRFVDNLTSNKKINSHRLRYRYQIQYPVKSIGNIHNPLFLVLHNEIFTNLTAQTQKIFDRNRLFVGLGFNTSRKSNIQLGYMNQFANDVSSSTSVTNHLAFIGYTYNPKIYK